MKKALITLGIIVALVIILIILGPLYILSEGEQSVVTRFGAIVKVETEPGLKFKMPFVDTVVRYSSKVLSWDGDAQRIPTKENQFIYVDPTSRWIISDPKRFYETVKTVENAQLRLDDILDSTVRTVISENYLNEAVRNSNRINQMTVVEEVSSIDDLEAAERLRSLTVSNTQQESIRVGRQGLSD
ncbi:MAG: protease modulator HflC, partial [Spirochaetales bacterium]|nr:protease modulator HflC [Spirochaetales bacterium]